MSGRLDGSEFVGRSEDLCARHIPARYRRKGQDGRNLDLSFETEFV